MASESLDVTTTDSVAYFDKCSRAFALKETSPDAFSKWITLVFPKVVVKNISFTHTKKSQLGPGGGQNQMKVLGIGSGLGRTDYMFLEQLVNTFRNISNTSLETSAENIAKFKSNVARGSIEGVTWYWKQLTWAKYFFGFKVAPKFHVIHAVHSFYHLHDLHRDVLNMHECLEEEGVMLIIVVSDESGTWKLRNKFPTFAVTGGTNVCSAHVRGILQAQNIPFQLVKQQSRFDITCCFEQGSHEGELITDHLSQTVDFSKTVSPDLVEDFFTFLRGPNCAIQEDATTLFIDDWDAIIVTK